MENEILLTIAIPTYNRARFLNKCLESIYEQLGDLGNIGEIIISDNCSTDNTKEIIDLWVKKQMPIQYFRNEINAGADYNFVHCFHLSRGKYIWLIGDDDFILPGGIKKVKEVLQKDYEFGLLHINSKQQCLNRIELYTDSDLFVKSVNYWITFISENIVNRSYIECISFNRYIGSFLIQIVLYLTAAVNSKCNVVMYDRIICGGTDANNGGYSPLRVFVQNYIQINSEFEQQRKLKKSTIHFLKRKVFKVAIDSYMQMHFYDRKNVRFKKDNDFRIIFKYYKYNYYFYIYYCYAVLGYYKKKFIQFLLVK